MEHFDVLDAKTHGLYLDLFGEEVEIQPRLHSDYTIQSPDPQRQAKRVRAIFSLGFDDQALKGEMRGNEQIGGTRVADAPAKVWLTAADYDGIGYVVRSGDAVKLVSRSGQPAFSVVRCYRSNQGDVTIDLARELQ